MAVPDVGDLPDSFDWRDHNAVTAVKDQGKENTGWDEINDYFNNYVGSVGTCWAFSTVQNVEGQWFMRNQTLTNLSVEQIVDCDSMQKPDAFVLICIAIEIYR